jgi:cyclophilin family peptidyl-prolyl cis-trans isomerase
MWRCIPAVCSILILLAPVHSRGADIVTFETVLGNFQVELLSDDAPATVANFLNYVNRGDYDGSFVHRTVPGFVIQGGGFSYDPVSGFPVPVQTDPPVVNEFKVSNTRGTVAMAKLSGNPNSATSQWFINLGDNSALDGSNGGFTVFGRVLGDGMDVVDAIATTKRWNLLDWWGNAFTEIPLINFNGTVAGINGDILVNISKVSLDQPEPEPFVIDITSLAPITGLWWGGTTESGWGVTLTQQANIIFVTLFTYDSAGLPVWYVASNCTISGDGCEGLLYRVTGGTPVTQDWVSTPPLNVEAVGTISFTFTGNDAGEMNLTIDGVSGTKTIERQVWSILSPGQAKTALWYGGEAESGWGVTLIQQTDIAFVTVFTYGPGGLPMWYVASSCTISVDGCSGTLYEVTGGKEITVPWNGTVVDAKDVGSVEFVFSDDDNGTVSFTINGESRTRNITRQIWATPES